MRISPIVTGVALAVSLSMSGLVVQSAYAQNASTVTCGDFLKMSAADQEAAFNAAKAAMPAKSAVASTSTDKSTQDAPKPPMDAGAVVSACQAAAPASSVMDAVTHAMSGTSNSGG